MIGSLPSHDDAVGAASAAVRIYCHELRALRKSRRSRLFGKKANPFVTAHNARSAAVTPVTVWFVGGGRCLG